MDDNGRPAGGTVGALMEAMDLLDRLPPAGPALRERGYTTESDLLDGLADPDATVRRGCLELLADARSDDAVPRVLERLDDPEWEVRYYAVHALAHPAVPPDHGPADLRAGDADVVPAAINTVRTDSSRYVRMLAVELVAGAANHDLLAEETLRRVSEGDSDAGVRRKAARYTPGGTEHPRTQ